MMKRAQLLAQIEAQLAPSLVAIDETAIAAMQPDFSGFSLASVRLPFVPETPRDAIPYILAQTALQYRFWDGHGARYTRYAVGDKVGSAAMVAGFEKAWGTSSEPCAGILACASVGFSRAHEVLDSYFGDIPDAESRADILFEVLGGARILSIIETLDTAFKSGHAGLAQAMLIADVFPTAYGDPFLKKAMLAVGLMIAEYRRAGFGCTEDLMAYADYQVPAVLRHLGILVYSDELAEMVDTRQHIKKGSQEEVAIRAATIIACEKFANLFGVTAAETDWFFWLKRKLPEKPFHLTYTTAY